MGKKKKTSRSLVIDYISKFHEDNLYLPARAIYFGGQDNDDEVNCRNVGQVIKNLYILDNINHSTITLFLNSPGGEVEDGLALYDVIRSLKSRVVIIGLGKVYSMSSIIMQAGAKRLMMPNSYFMIHDGKIGYEGNSKDYEAWAGWSKKVRKLTYKIYYDRMKERRSRITYAEIEDMCASDTILSADEAVEMGLVDEVIKIK